MYRLIQKQITKIKLQSKRYELHLPGLEGFKKDVLQVPQPLAWKGEWEAAVSHPCTEKCNKSMELVTELRLNNKMNKI